MTFYAIPSNAGQFGPPVLLNFADLDHNEMPQNLKLTLNLKH